MSSTSVPSVAPIALQAGEGEARWFLGALGTIKASADTTAGRLAVLEYRWPKDTGSPLHVHHNEDEWFYVIDGELTLWVGGEVIVAPAGSFVYGPRDIPHTFFVTLRARGALPAGDRPRPLRRLRARDVRAGTGTHAPARIGAAPVAEELTAGAAEYGIEVLGPPGIPA